MEWVVEPLRAFGTFAGVSEGSTCSGGGTQNWCDCAWGLKTCNCGQGLVLGEAPKEAEQQK